MRFEARTFAARRARIGENGTPLPPVERGRFGKRRTDERQHIAARDASPGPGTVHGGKIDAMFACQPSHDRRMQVRARAGTAVAARCGRSDGCCGGNGGHGNAGIGDAVDAREFGADGHRRAIGHENLADHAGVERRDLGVDLVRCYFEERFVDGDVVADGLEPTNDRAFGDALAELRHRDRAHLAIGISSFSPAAFAST